MLLFREYRGWWMGLLLGPALGFGPSDLQAAPPTVLIDFARDIQPILAARCYDCHGPTRQKHGLRLDLKAAALQGGDSGPVIVPGKSSESKLIRLVSGLDPDEVMPPKGDKLAAEQVALLRAWIDQGAPWPDAPVVAQNTAPPPSLWSLRPLGNSPVPVVNDPNWPRNAIDHFVLHAMEQKGLTPSPEAERVTLLRRLKFDLQGLPPTPEEIDAFLQNSTPNAYERVVDRLLAEPQYGERWGRHWLDVARYTESQGFEYDHMRENAWPYRDYVINSFNEDRPYNLFVKEQIAGDALDPVTHPGIIATGFLVCGPWDQAGSSQANVTQRMITREEELEDIVSVVAQSFLGLTVNCARCHSHKFDPIPQTDYYRIKAVFEGVNHGDAPVLTALEFKAREQAISQLKACIAEAQSRLREMEAAEELDASFPDAERPERAQLRADLAQLNRELDARTALFKAYVGQRNQPAPTHRLQRGDVRTPMEVVAPGALSGVTQLDSDFGLPADVPEAQRRLRFAQWVTDTRNPLPARVLVNRLWQYHFGQGIVATPNDLGSAGAGPSHPELLDWLARELVRQQWSIKALQRLIVCSAAYRQSSDYRAAAARMDADNQLLWRFTPHRLEAEALRDAMLSASGQLNTAAGGPSFRPFDTKQFNATFYFPQDKAGPEFDRRTVYRMNVNSGKDPLLEAFDCPEPSIKTPRRGVTTTPLQALSLMNSSFVQRQAQHLAARVRCEAHSDDTLAISLAYRYCLGRKPMSTELERAANTAGAADLQTVCWALLNTTEFLYVR